MTYASTILADSPVAYWRLGEPSGTNANDEVGTLDGTYQATPTLGVTGALSGDADTAVSFDVSETEYISVPDNAVIDLGDGPLSYEIWFKRAVGTQNSGCLISKGTSSPILLIDDSGLGVIEWYARGVGVAITGTTTLTDTTSFHHIVGTKDSSDNWKLYLDGADITGTPGGTPSTVSNATELNIGRDNGATPGTYLYGSVDEVAIYNVVLTSTQVAAHYAAGTVVTPTWTTPADTVSMSTTPDLKFTSPTSAVKQHFQLQLDTVNTFNSGNLRTYDSSTVQTNWTYYNGASWVAIPSDGLPIAYAGNEVDYTVTSALSGATWYRRVRAGTLV